MAETKTYKVKKHDWFRPTDRHEARLETLVTPYDEGPHAMQAEPTNAKEK